MPKPKAEIIVDLVEEFFELTSNVMTAEEWSDILAEADRKSEE